MQSYLDAVQRRAVDSICVRCVVTTGNDRDPTSEQRAQSLVTVLNTCTQGVRAHWSSRYHTASRPQTLTKLMAQHQAEGVLVVDGSGTHMKTVDGEEFRLHGGIGVLRLRNVLSGRDDTLCSVCALREGDTFVDATAGQCQDALVAAAAVGPSGRVIALEASPLLWAVTSGRPVATGNEIVDQLLNERIEVRLGEASSLLAQMPDRSADVVYADPMWQRPQKSSHSFGLLRRFAHAERLSSATIAQACRVARRAVVVMDQTGGEELERLGMRIIQSGQRKRFGVLMIGDPESRARAPSLS